MIVAFDTVIVLPRVDRSACVGVPRKPTSNSGDQHEQSQQQILVKAFQTRYRISKALLEIADYFAATNRQQITINLNANASGNRVN